ncbi:MAG: alpha/beta fold hydrolase [Alphaproteobacteria bacterium]|nr:alpha/beta fold hydrolase [Alphaproteobacteria bacterium]
MIWLLVAAAALAAIIIAMMQNANVYARKVEAAFPPLGRMVALQGQRTPLHVIDRGPGDAPPVLLLHGASANAREFLALAAALEDDHRLLLADRPGYGYSPRLPHAEKIAVQAEAFIRLLEVENAAPAVLVGHSLGCGVCLRIAILRPDLVTGLVLTAPASHPYPGGNAWWAETAARPLVGPLFCRTLVPLLAPGAAKGAIANTFAPAEPPPDYARQAAVPLAFRPRAFRASACDVVATKREYPRQAPLYPEIMSPTVIITADKDRVVSPKIHARNLAADLQSAELICLPGVGHMPQWLRPDIAAQAVRRVRAIAAARETEG